MDSIWRWNAWLAGAGALRTHEGWIGEAPELDGALSELVSNAEQAVQAVDGSVLCSQRGEGLLVWSGGVSLPVTGLPAGKLWPTAGGCAVVASERIAVLGTSGEQGFLQGDLTLLAAVPELVVRDGDRLVRWEADGFMELGPAPPKVSAWHPTGTGGWVGFEDGTVGRWKAGDVTPTARLQGAPGAAVSTLMAGPGGAIFVGFGDGTAGLWDGVSGQELFSRKLHGEVDVVDLRGSELVFVTDVGDHVQFDIGPLLADRCALRDEVVDAVPVVWRDGQIAVADGSKEPCTP